jgi:competence protein ComEC
MNPRLAVLCALSAITGIWLYEKFSVTGTVFIAFLVIVIIFQLNSKAFLVLIMLPLFFFYSHWYELNNKSLIPLQKTSFHGTVETIPKINGKMINFQYKTREETIVVRYKMKSEDEKHALEKIDISMKCQLNGTLKKPEPQSHFYGMNYLEYLHNKKIHWVLEPFEIDENSCISSTRTTLSSYIKLWRSKSIKQIENHFSDNTAGLMNALIFGYREKIEPQTLEAYQKLGLTHLLAVSGYNVGIVSYFLYLFFVRAGIIKELSYVLIVFFLPLYIVTTGGESSIVRAGIMGMLVLCFIVFQKKLNPAILLSAVCILMLIWNPLSIFDLGFQLSFLMTFVLITSISLLGSRSNLQLLIITSSICSLFSFPIIIYHFYEFSLWSVPLNIIYIPFVSLVLFPVSFLMFLCVLLFPKAVFLFKLPVQFLFEGSASFLEFSQTFNGTLLLGRPAFWLLFLYFLAILYWFFRWENKRRFHPKYTVPFLIIMAMHSVMPYMNQKASVSFINVGQGDSILIELPNREAVYLIDTGGSVAFEKEEWEEPDEEYDVTKKVVLPYLKGRGIRKIDGLILTHGDMDHAGGADYLMNHFSVKNVYLPKSINHNQLEKEIIKSAKHLGININLLSKGMQWGSEQTHFLIMHPGQKKSTSNNGSIVFWAKLYQTSFLFTGDIEKEAETEIMNNYSRLEADVLKVAHHGSKTSTTEKFLKESAPEYAVISSGKNNRYGHPDIEVINRLKSKGIIIYRTDKNGDIRFVVGKHSIRADTVQ